MDTRKILFISTLIILGIGVGIALIYDRYKQHESCGARMQVAQELFIRHKNSKQRDKMDLSSDEDLTVAVMNLLGIEEHLFFTGAKAKKAEYYDLIDEVRTVRKALLKKLIPRYEGEVWCISKHLLAASYRLMETGAKQLHLGNKKEAYKLFDQGYQLYLNFWRINANSLQASPINSKQLFAGVSKDKLDSEKQVKMLTSLAGKADKSSKDHFATRACAFDSGKINCCNE